MPVTSADPLYRTLAKAITYAAGVIILIWFLYKASAIILLLLFALILALVINAPIARLEGKGMKRVWASLLVFGIIVLILVVLGWLIVPKVSTQITTLMNNLPGYANQVSANISSWFEGYPQIHKEIQEGGINLSQVLPSLPRAIMRIGNYSLSIVTAILIGILFISMVVYAVASPRPLLQLYFTFFSKDNQAKATRALQEISVMLIGWFRSNLIAGTIRATCMIIFLNIMNVPGAWVWGALAFFAELIPKLGFYIASIPPILVALSVSPMTALWTTVFLLALDELMGDFILPKLRSKTMNIHPVSILFILLAMAAVFGVMGALLATPLTAIIKAYYENFFVSNNLPEAQVEAQIDAVLYTAKPLPETTQQAGG